MINVTDNFASHLRLYNERASELGNSAFLRQVRTRHPIFHLQAAPFNAVRQGAPADEAMKAFLLTFRLFIQRRDKLSFKDIEHHYSQIDGAEEFRREVASIRNSLEDYLRKPSPIVVKGERLLREELLNVWLYGELAHLNREKRQVMKRWGVAEDVRAFFQHEFEQIIIRVASAIDAVRQVNSRALECLTDKVPSQHE